MIFSHINSPKLSVKKMTKYLLLLAFAFPMLASADEFRVDPAQKNLLTAYTRMLGGMYMNDKCQYLSTADGVAYQQGVQVISNALVKATRDTKTMQLVNETVKQQATSGKNGVCNDENGRIVESLYAYTTKLAYDLIVDVEDSQKKL